MPALLRRHYKFDRRCPVAIEHNEKRLIFSGGLFAAASSGALSICTRLLDAGLDVDTRDGRPSGYTALMLAAMSGQVEVAKELLARGADAGAPAVNHDSPIRMAVDNCDGVCGGPFRRSE